MQTSLVKKGVDMPIFWVLAGYAVNRSKLSFKFLDPPLTGSAPVLY